MAKKSGSKSSRSERRAGRKRAEQAREHGLPQRQVPPPRARSAAPEPRGSGHSSARSSDAAPVPAKKSAGIPTLVKVLGGALVILTGVYLLSRQRDEALTETKLAPEPSAVSAVAAVSAAPEVEAIEPGAAATSVLDRTPAPVAEPPAAVVAVTPPTKPVVAAPVVVPPSKPKVAVPAVKAVPSPVTVAAPAAPAVPVVSPVAPAPKPAAPKPAPPADNPY